MATDEEVVTFMRDYCAKNVFERKPKGKYYHDEYKASWRKEARDFYHKDPTPQLLSDYTHKQIQAEAVRLGIEVNKHVTPNADLNFDLFNPGTGTAFELCLGSPKGEFCKDVLKGLIDEQAHKLVIFHREIAWPRRDNPNRYRYRGSGYLEHPAQKEIIRRAHDLKKLEVKPITLIADGPDILAPPTQ
jgi:hypothetical protein